MFDPLAICCGEAQRGAKRVKFYEFKELVLMDGSDRIGHGRLREGAGKVDMHTCRAALLRSA